MRHRMGGGLSGGSVSKMSHSFLVAPNRAGREIAAPTSHGYDGTALQMTSRILSAKPVVALVRSRSLQRRGKPLSGGVAEWTKALVLKTSEVNASQGSNPCPSAKFVEESIVLIEHFYDSAYGAKAQGFAKSPTALTLRTNDLTPPRPSNSIEHYPNGRRKWTAVWHPEMKLVAHATATHSKGLQQASALYAERYGPGHHERN